uniref:Flavin reductase (NADPH)-like n=1 Tax=Saccoglossus kowalevskii TaxID=10224 RepID=A0ABM0M1G4_SACKO|nr:PREDICTED: flavin reductase (NADPH)-like [Saccoglossus kowalevskii]
MKIAVLGATGRTGIPFVRQALDQGHHVVAVVRNPSKLTVQHENLQIVTADIFSEESMVPHFTGSDAVVSCLASLTLSKSTFFLDSCKIILSAMRKAGVSRFMPMSSWCTTCRVDQTQSKRAVSTAAPGGTNTKASFAFKHVSSGEPPVPSCGSPTDLGEAEAQWKAGSLLTSDTAGTSDSPSESSICNDSVSHAFGVIQSIINPSDTM